MRVLQKNQIHLKAEEKSQRLDLQILEEPKEKKVLKNQVTK